MSKEAIVIFSFSYLVGWVDMCLSSYFTALDQPSRSLAVSVFGTLVFPLLALFSLAPALGLTGVWLAWPVATLASCALALVLFETMKVWRSADASRAEASA
jgi:Na+-driven multidrug efflux pump